MMIVDACLILIFFKDPLALVAAQKTGSTSEEDANQEVEGDGKGKMEREREAETKEEEATTAH